MKEIWIIGTKESDKIILNIMTALQKADLLATNKRKDVVFQLPIGCDELRVKNINVDGTVINCNWFDRILINNETFKVSEKGSLLCEVIPAREGD